jgi:DNA processing protein
MLLTNAQDLLDTIGWTDVRAKPVKAPEMFVTLSEEEQKLVAIIQQNETVHIDELNMHSGLSGSTVAAAMLNMELQGVIRCLPGKLYRMN